MTIENELKLIPREAITLEEVLKELKTNGYLQLEDIKIGIQKDTYYDDQENTLYKNNCSFRIRRTEKGAAVTYKTPIDSNTTYKERNEIEIDIPREIIDKDENIKIEDVINFLKSQYPNENIPENLTEKVTVVNNRKKTNIQAKDETIIEICFDDLNIQNNNGTIFAMNNEIECEVKSGEKKNLDEIYKIINEKYDIQLNSLSKYSRAIREMQEQRKNMSLEEVTICIILSDILRTNVFEQLKYKGQMLHDYKIRMPDNLNMNHFKNSEYLIDKISEIKRTKDYKTGRIKTLEDMFLCFFSDMDYKEIEYKLVNFLNENYYKMGSPITNRMLHSHQVMLTTGLISKSKEITESEKKTLLCMTSALLHDIGHVPGAHGTERILENFDGFFSHEINGRNVIEGIISKDEESIIQQIEKYGKSIGEEYEQNQMRQYVQKIKTQIKKSIEAHSRTNSEKRGDGTVVQLPREADKICYSVSDIVDAIKRTEEGEHIEFFSPEWKEKIITKIGKGYQRGETVKQRLEEIEKLINTYNFGEIITNAANTIRENVTDSMTYYDVEQTTWEIINEMIKYVKDLRTSGVIKNKKAQLEYCEAFFITKKFNECLKQCNGDIETAWDKAINLITESNDIDILNCVEEIRKIYAQKPEKLKNAFLKGGILSTEELKSLDNSDRQIKMQPMGVFQISDLLPQFGKQYHISTLEIIRDTYFESNNNISLCLREYIGSNRKQFIVKRKRDKEGVTQVERQKYVTESYNSSTLQELIEKFNIEHKNLEISIPKGKQKCVIMTIRTNAENEEGTIIRKDISTIITDSGEIQMPETIEIECIDKNEIKKVKMQLNEFLDKYYTNTKTVITKETKEEQAMRIIKEQQQKIR